MTIASYETLYESSIAYGIRKALMAEQKRTELDQQLRQLALNKRDLLNQVESLKKTIESTVARATERREAEEKGHADEVTPHTFLGDFTFEMILLPKLDFNGKKGCLNFQINSPLDDERRAHLYLY